VAYKCKHCSRRFLTLSTARNHHCAHNSDPTRVALEGYGSDVGSFTIDSWPSTDTLSGGGGDFDGGGASGGWD